MNAIDIIIVIVVILILGAIVYFNFIRRPYSPCRGCPSYKACGKDGKEELIKFYHENRDKENHDCCCKEKESD